MEEVDVRFVVVFGPHLDRKEVMATPLGFLARCVLCEEGFSDFWEIMKRARRQGLEPL